MVPVCPQVWEVASGGVVFEVGAKSVHKEAWPLLHWGAEDASLFHGVTNTVHQYSRADGFKGEWEHLVGVMQQQQQYPSHCHQDSCHP